MSKPRRASVCFCCSARAYDLEIYSWSLPVVLSAGPMARRSSRAGGVRHRTVMMTPPTHCQLEPPIPSTRRHALGLSRDMLGAAKLAQAAAKVASQHPTLAWQNVMPQLPRVRDYPESDAAPTAAHPASPRFSLACATRPNPGRLRSRRQPSIREARPPVPRLGCSGREPEASETARHQTALLFQRNLFEPLLRSFSGRLSRKRRW